MRYKTDFHSPFLLRSLALRLPLITVSIHTLPFLIFSILHNPLFSFPFLLTSFSSLSLTFLLSLIPPFFSSSLIPSLFLLLFSLPSLSSLLSFPPVSSLLLSFPSFSSPLLSFPPFLLLFSHSLHFLLLFSHSLPFLLFSHSLPFLLLFSHSSLFLFSLSHSSFSSPLLSFLHFFSASLIPSLFFSSLSFFSSSLIPPFFSSSLFPPFFSSSLIPSLFFSSSLIPSLFFSSSLISSLFISSSLIPSLFVFISFPPFPFLLFPSHTLPSPPPLLPSHHLPSPHSPSSPPPPLSSPRWHAAGRGVSCPRRHQHTWPTLVALRCGQSRREWSLYFVRGRCCLPCACVMAWQLDIAAWNLFGIASLWRLIAWGDMGVSFSLFNSRLVIKRRREYFAVLRIDQKKW
ncbi:hypothetical protein C7M84_002184 [Penaeus vannamei]|uniref:Uncharacterized protein n=1 Tax=Penaeus vannamei TaxID=6689 RepID=A0A423TRP4_PENVA|nr:hypothetical protein C7M84_002184 [Penaeus vannamei]